MLKKLLILKMHAVNTLFTKWTGIKDKLLRSTPVYDNQSYLESGTDLYNKLIFINHDDDVDTNIYVMYLTDIFLNNIYNLDDDQRTEMANTIYKHGYFVVNKIKIKIPETLWKKLQQNIHTFSNNIDLNEFLDEIMSLSEGICINSHSEIDFSDAEIIEYGNEKYKAKPFNKSGFRNILKRLIPTSPQTIKEIFPVPFDSPITKKELYDTIINTKKTAVVGPDYVPINKYVNLKNDYLFTLLELFNAFLEHYYIPSEFKLSTLRFIRKPGTSGRELDDYRFISVFNTDYKLFTKILNNRLSHYMKTMMSVYQKGWNRKNSTQDIFENLGLLDFAIQWVPDDGDILYMDFKSAYESVCHELLFEVAKMTKIDNFSKLLKALYNGGELIYKDHLSIQHSRGLRLGDPLSPTLFALVMNIFTRYMQSRHYLSGIQLKLDRYSFSQINIISYVDDFLMIARSQKDALAYIKSIDKFCNVANFKINHKKTTTFKGSIRKYGYFDYLNIRYTMNGIERYSATSMLNKLVKVTCTLPITSDDILYHEGVKTRHYINQYLRKVLFISGVSPDFKETKSIMSFIMSSSFLGKHNISQKQDPDSVKRAFIDRIINDNTNIGYVALTRALLTHPDRQYVQNSGAIMKMLDKTYDANQESLIL